MGWFNYIGLIIVAVIMIPNVVYAVKCRDGFVNLWQCKMIETLEQIGRYSCFALMIFNIPYAYLGVWFNNGLWWYVAVNAALVAAYLLIWIILFDKNSVFRAAALSVLPSVIFLFSGIALANFPLIGAAAIFAPCHILISCKNAAMRKRSAD